MRGREYGHASWWTGGRDTDARANYGLKKVGVTDEKIAQSLSVSGAAAANKIERRAIERTDGRTGEGGTEKKRSKGQKGRDGWETEKSKRRTRKKSANERNGGGTRAPGGGLVAV